MAEANYYAIIPANVRYDSELSDKAKLLYGEITALTNKEGYCWASNSYFAELYGVKILCIKRNIKDLVDKGYLKSVLIYDGKLVKERRLYLSSNIVIPNYENDYGIKKDTRGGIKKDTRGGIKKDTDNNTSINNTSINIYSQVIDYLNKKAETKYRSTTKKNKDLIKARLNEGFTKEDFIKVIDNKVKEWANTDMQKYLRPETLFGTKFEGYLNQKEVVSNGQYSNGKHGNRWSAGKNKSSFNIETNMQFGELSEEDRRRAEELI
ncbi:MAG: conserved phage C-terminal domain-containing protein [Clostridium celatum]|nr:conserved phage C-terminal domain-containing protein [Clostridium celatum]